jgi:hypothetical protein
MVIVKRTLFFIAMLVWIGAAAFSADFGVLLNQVPQLENGGKNTTFSWTATLVPRFSAPLGERSSLYLSAGLNAKYQNDNEWQWIPELYRFEALFVTPSRAEWRIGRSEFRDPLGFIANGLFDGLSAAVHGEKGTIRAGAWYTGFLYKRNAVITMTTAEQAAYDRPVKDPESYFAPARAVVNLGWERAGLLAEEDVFSLGLLGQFDLRQDRESGPAYHSQYLILTYGRSWNRFGTEFGGTAELVEANDTAVGLAAYLSLNWMFGRAGRLGFAVRWASGNHGGVLTAFTPITTELQGRVLKAKLSGLMVFEADYGVRLARPLSAELSVLYALRTDRETFSAVKESSSYLLGAELSGRLVWVPVSDISCILGGGVFLPQGAYSSSALQWQVSLGVVISLY